MLTCVSDLQEAFNLFDPLKALATEEEQESYFVPRPNEPLEEIKTYLQNTTSAAKILFSGHRGSGKSSALNRLALGLEEEFFVVKFSIKDSLDIFDIKHIDVILILALKLLHRAIESNIPIDEKDLPQWLIGISGGKIPGFSIEDNEPILSSLKKFQERIRVEETTRSCMRSNLEPRLSTLIEKTNTISSEIEKNTSKKPLLIIDGFDKISLEDAYKLFYGYAQILSSPYLRIIYTFPIALQYSPVFQQIAQNFSSYFILPNVVLNDEGKRVLRKVIIRRIDERCMEEGVIEQVSELSGGLMLSLITLIHNAILYCLTCKKAIIEKKDILKSANEIRNSYRIGLKEEHYPLLKRVHQEKRIINEPLFQELLHNIALLEYRNGNVWADVHPIVLPLVK